MLSSRRNPDHIRTWETPSSLLRTGSSMDSLYGVNPNRRVVSMESKLREPAPYNMPTADTAKPGKKFDGLRTSDQVCGLLRPDILVPTAAPPNMRARDCFAGAHGATSNQLTKLNRGPYMMDDGTGRRHASNPLTHAM